MITEVGLLEEFNLISNSGWSKIAACPCHWDDPNKTFKVNRKACLFSCVMSALIGISLATYPVENLVNAGIYNAAGPMNKSILALVLLISYGTFVIAYFAFVNYSQSSLVEMFFNELAGFEGKHIQHERDEWKNKLKKRKMTRLALITSQISRISCGTMIAPLIAMSSVILPEFPLNILGYYPSKVVILGLEILEMKILPWKSIGWLIGKGVTVFGNLIAWYGAGKMWSIIITEIVTGCTGLTTALLQFERMVTTRSLESVVNIHRQINYLVNVFNHLESTLLVLMLIHVVNAQLTCGFNLLQNHHILSVSLIAFYILILLQGIVSVTLVYGFCAEVHDISMKIMKRLKTKSGMSGSSSSKSKVYRKIVRSIPILKVTFGSANYIEKLTPVGFQQFAVARLVDCVLLSHV